MINSERLFLVFPLLRFHKVTSLYVSSNQVISRKISRIDRSGSMTTEGLARENQLLFRKDFFFSDFLDEPLDHTCERDLLQKISGHIDQSCFSLASQ